MTLGRLFMRCRGACHVIVWGVAVPPALMGLIAAGAVDAAWAQGSTARSQAPFDPSGYWRSLVTEDWSYRMVLPQRGDYVGVPLSLAAKQFADNWDRSADEAAGKQCEAYGAGAVMLVPEHLRIQWQDDNILKVQTDAGMQTRLLHFTAATPSEPASWQGWSTAQWILQPPAQGGDLSRKALGFGVASTEKAVPMGQLRIDTTDMLPGLLRKNGLPYGDRARLREYWEVDDDRDSDHPEQLLVDTAILSDPVYLHDDYYFNAVFEKLPDASQWHPSPCSFE